MITMMKRNREQPLVESSKLWVRRQQSCAIHNVKAESAGSSSHHVKKNVERNEQLSRTLEQVVADTGTHRSDRYDGAARRRHLLTSEHSLNNIRCLTGSQWRSSRMVLAIWSNFRLPVMSNATTFWTHWSGRKMVFTHAIENTVAVVHATWNQGVDQCHCSISGQWATYCTKWSKLVPYPQYVNSIPGKVRVHVPSHFCRASAASDRWLV